MSFTSLSSTSARTVRGNEVLRNTYLLLAMSLLPTVVGAWIGVQSGILNAMGPLMATLVFFAGSFGLIYAVEKNKNSAAGVPWLLAFTFFMGVMLSRLLSFVLSKSAGAELIVSAGITTTAVFAAMAFLSSVIKRDLSGLGRFLFIGAIIVLVASLLNLFFQSGVLMLVLTSLTAAIFSAFVLVDLKAVRDGYETNYITATMGIYLSLYNVFSSVLQLFGIFDQD